MLKLAKLGLRHRCAVGIRRYGSVWIRNGTVANHDGVYHADVYIEGDKITKVGAVTPPEVAAGTREIDATGKYVIPGGIDPHVHMAMPFMGTTSIDDYAYGTRAAVAGGTTMLLDFVIPAKGQSLLEAYDAWKGRATPDINCDIGFHMAVTWFGGKSMLDEMTVLTNELGVNSYKFFLAYNGVLRTYDDEITKAFRHMKSIGALGMVHAENGDYVKDMEDFIYNLGIHGPEGHALARPEETEAEATHRAITLAHHVGLPLYVVHVMSKAAAEEVSRAKALGLNVYGETLAAALGTDGRGMFHPDWRHAAGYVMSPPLREDPQTKRYLMQSLIDGRLDLVGSDNCTFSSHQKALGKDDFRRIPNGVNGIEDRMSVIWHKGVRGLGMSVPDFVNVSSTKAARIFNLYPRKGSVSPGADADVVVWDGEASRFVSATTHHHAVDFNIFEGQRHFGVADTTISRGKIVWTDNELFTEPGAGQILGREPFGFVYRDVGALGEKLLERKVAREPYTGPVVEVSKQPVLQPLDAGLHDTLARNLPEADLMEVTRLLYGLNQGKLVTSVPLSEEARALARKEEFDIALHRFDASDRTTSGISPRTVRFAVTQNSIALSADAPVEEQHQALKNRHGAFVKAAALAGVNILCFQEICHLHL